MSTTIFKYAAITAVFIAAIGAALWYFLAPPATQPGTVPKNEAPGTIEGTTLYPSEFVPAQKVCAQSVADPLYERCTDVPEVEGTAAPTFSVKVAPGKYVVYALLKDPSDLGLTESRRAYWTEFVRCGMTTNCTDHTHLEVVVGSDQRVLDVRPHDWYAN